MADVISLKERRARKRGGTLIEKTGCVTLFFVIKGVDERDCERQLQSKAEMMAEDEDDSIASEYGWEVEEGIA